MKLLKAFAIFRVLSEAIANFLADIHPIIHQDDSHT
jgi:hypothetical protein